MKIKFFFEGGTKFTATDVVQYNVNRLDNILTYSTDKKNGDTWTTSTHNILIDDLLYAIVLGEGEDENHNVTIISGLAHKFDVDISVSEQKKLLDDAHQQAIIEDKKFEFIKKEREKYIVRKKKRWEQHLADIDTEVKKD